MAYPVIAATQPGSTTGSKWLASSGHIPLLAEGQRSAEFDVVIVVDVPAKLQVSRLAARGPPEDQARARMAAQATREQRPAIADIVIDNSGTLEAPDHRVAGVWSDLEGRARRKS